MEQPITEVSALMNEADDLVFKMRMLAGSGDLQGASRVVSSLIDLLNDASALDRQDDTDDTAMALAYVLNQFQCAASNIQGIFEGNLSRTAREARMYREQQAA